MYIIGDGNEREKDMSWEDYATHFPGLEKYGLLQAPARRGGMKLALLEKPFSSIKNTLEHIGWKDNAILQGPYITASDVVALGLF